MEDEKINSTTENSVEGMNNNEEKTDNINVDVIPTQDNIEKTENVSSKEETEDDQVKKIDKIKKVTFPMSFFATIIDEAICLGVAYALEFAINALMKVSIGYTFNNTIEAIFLLYIIIKIIYVPVMECKFKGQTLGKSLFNLKVVEK